MENANDTVNIQGLDLMIDPNVQKLCEVSNSTSSSTRSILYILVLVNILAFIAVWNTSYHNWNESRIKAYNEQLKAKMTRYQNLVRAKAQTPSYPAQGGVVAKDGGISAGTMDIEIDNCLDSINYLTKKRDYKIQNYVESYMTVKMPVLGNAFDINDLGVIAGLSFFILLFILNYTMKREVNNLKIALKAITERYSADADGKVFHEYLVKNSSLDSEKTLMSINEVRRKHHYNYLSMNEVFTDPPLDLNIIPITARRKVLKKLFLKFEDLLSYILKVYLFFPAAVYFFIVRNDLNTQKVVQTMNPERVLFNRKFYVIFICLIFCLSFLCTMRKYWLRNLYKTFYSNQYKY